MTRLGIRGKFLLLSALMATLPLFGLHFVAQTEAFLRDSLQRSVAAAAAATALAVGDRGYLATAETGDLPLLYAHPMSVPPQIDGYDKDWSAIAEYAEPLLPETADAPPGDGRYLVASHAEHVYLLIQVIDDEVVYGDPRLSGPGDSLQLLLHDQRGRLRRLLLATSAPGWVSVFERGDGARDRYEPRVRAEWQSRGDGYVLEVRLPRDLVSGQDLGVLVEDRDRHGGATRLSSRLASAWNRDVPVLLPLVLPSPAIQEVLGASGLVAGRRVRVLDRHGYVVARAGNLAAIAEPEPVNPLVAWLLPPPDPARLAALPDDPRVRDALLDTALAGHGGGRWIETGQDGVHVVAAAEPVRDAGGVVGAILVEESTSTVLSARRRALASLFDVTLLTGLLGTLALLVFAGRVSTRLRRLRDEADRSIDAQGRIRQDFHAPRGDDEIGDLGRNFAAMLQRLHGYNEYLENLARRLSHELRTPLAVVRSSLGAMAVDPESAERYRERAHQGVERLDNLLTRMSEATRIERAVLSSDREPVRIDALLRSAVDGYVAAFAPRRLVLDAPDQPLWVLGSPELLVQMLDKLVANAIDFGLPEQPIRVRLARSAPRRVRLEVSNHGPLLPSDAEHLFDSMVSVRHSRADRDEQPHLGLGLYVVRLVAGFHDGTASASNLEDGSGVCVSVEMAESAPGAERV